MRKFVSLFILILCACTCMAQYTVTSPDRTVRVNLDSNRGRKGMSKFFVPLKMRMRVSYISERLVNSEIGLTVKSHGHRYEFGKSDILRVNQARRQMDHPETRDPALADMEGQYNTLMMVTESGIILEVRAYNNGVAYRYSVTGYTDDYKILDVIDVFPGEKPTAILGTFEGNYTLPWRTMKVEVFDDEKGEEQVKTTTKSPTMNQGTRFVKWRDALSSISVGTTYNAHTGDTWGDFTDYHTFQVEGTYKHLYGAVSVSPCNTIKYIAWGESEWPFEGMIKGVDMWSLGFKAGYCLPVQNGYEIWSFIPYLSADMMHLHQHGKIRPSYKGLSHHAHWSMGPGVKVQMATRFGFTLGAAYEYRFFLDNMAPDGMHGVSVSVGKTF